MRYQDRFRCACVTGQTTAAFTARAQVLAPAFFVFGGGPYVAATHANGAYIGPATLYPGLTMPAKPGETIALWEWIWINNFASAERFRDAIGPTESAASGDSRRGACSFQPGQDVQVRTHSKWPFMFPFVGLTHGHRGVH